MVYTRCNCGQHPIVKGGPLVLEASQVFYLLTSLEITHGLTVLCPTPLHLWLCSHSLVAAARPKLCWPHAFAC